MYLTAKQSIWYILNDNTTRSLSVDDRPNGATDVRLNGAT